MKAKVSDTGICLTEHSFEILLSMLTRIDDEVVLFVPKPRLSDAQKIVNHLNKQYKKRKINIALAPAFFYDTWWGVASGNDIAFSRGDGCVYDDESFNKKNK